ncbi:MAG: acyl-ACP desaturase [Chloroflexi bacterium]|nr:acyl-ACP desaturase [Chloroflexota bacterium]
MPEPGVFISPSFNTFFRTSERVMWKFSAVPWDKIERDKITEDDINAVRAAMLVESHNPIYSKVLLDYFAQDHEMAAFVVTWAYEELKHYGVLRTWLEATGMVDQVALEKELSEVRAGPWGDIESKFSVVQSFSYTMLQEELTGLFYQKFMHRIKEPVLKHIITLIMRDEYRHCQWYLQKAQQVLASGKGHIEEVYEMFMNFEMPGPTFIEEYGKHGQAMLKVAPPDANTFRDVMQKIYDLTGRRQFAKLWNSGPYLRKLKSEWGIDPQDIIAVPRSSAAPGLIIP